MNLTLKKKVNLIKISSAENLVIAPISSIGRGNAFRAQGGWWRLSLRKKDLFALEIDAKIKDGVFFFQEKYGWKFFGEDQLAITYKDFLKNERVYYNSL